MKYLILFAGLFGGQLANAQNLVTNGNFETYSSCPAFHGEIHKATGWKSPTQTSTDYLNACNFGLNSVPDNLLGSQPAASGNGYAGIYTFNENTHWQEYLWSSLAPLEVGASYKVSIKVSLADESKFATKGLGVYFYANGPSEDTAHTHALHCPAQIEYSNYGPITDSTNWTTLVDTFVADSAYNNFIIGFFHDSTGYISIVKPNSMWNSYYYIDDVEILKISSAGVREATQINASVSPQPFTTYTTLSFNDPAHKKHSLSIYNIQGRLVEKINNIATNEVRIERNDLSPGCYFYELKSEDGAVAKGKLFVQ
jgi:hypothetical protein